MPILGVDCPCGSGADEGECCGPILGGVPAPTALALMRSRYTAYARRAVPYLIATHDPATRSSVNRAALTTWCRDTAWRGLEIVDTVAGGADDTTGVVEFIAHGVSRGAPFSQRERSRFRRVDGRWYYTDAEGTPSVRSTAAAGSSPAPLPPALAASRPGRNDPCPCGSGQKYKRCHGR
jgi:SEC-C motif-containing protein